MEDGGVADCVAGCPSEIGALKSCLDAMKALDDNGDEGKGGHGVSLDGANCLPMLVEWKDCCEKLKGAAGSGSGDAVKGKGGCALFALPHTAAFRCCRCCRSCCLAVAASPLPWRSFRLSVATRRLLASSPALASLSK